MAPDTMRSAREKKENKNAQVGKGTIGLGK